MASDIFAKIGDIKGESPDDKHKGEIEVLSWSWGVTQSGTMAFGGGGGACGGGSCIITGSTGNKLSALTICTEQTVINAARESLIIFISFYLGITSISITQGYMTIVVRRCLFNSQLPFLLHLKRR